jgi:hypothetical protein
MILNKRNFSRFAAMLIALTTGILATGCGSSGPKTAEGRSKPKGRILENGLPIKIRTENLPPGDPGMTVTFIKVGSADAGEEIEAQIIDAAEGSFELIGADAKGIPPGKYRVEIIMAPVGGNDYFKGKYKRDKSKIEVEVKQGEDLVIDVAKFN